MNQISLDLVDYTFHRKIKPAQNLALVVVGVLWVVILPVLLLQIELLTRLAAYLMLFSILPGSVFLLLSIPFLFKRRTGKALLKDNELTINGVNHPLDHIEFKLNIHQSDWIDSSKSIHQKLKGLTIWGNYIYTGPDNKFEFEPHPNLHSYIDSLNVKGYNKRQALMVKTTDLFDNIMSIIWAAS